MQFQVCNSPEGYVVEAYVIEDPNSSGGYWYPLRNFGDRQGDAIEFKEIDCPRLEDSQIRQLIKQYRKENKYERLDGGRRFIRQR